MQLLLGHESQLHLLHPSLEKTTKHQTHFPSSNSRERNTERIEMGTKLIQPPIPSPHVAPSVPKRKMMKTHRPITATHHSITKKTTGFSSQHPLWIRPISSSTIRIAEQSSGNLIGDHEETIRIEQEQIKSVAQIKSNLYGALQGTQITYFSFLAHSHTYIISAKFY